jgi:hypothetical protein
MDGLNRRQRRLLHENSSGITTGNGPPSKKEGSNGSISIRNVDGFVKLYAKFNDVWYKI